MNIWPDNYQAAISLTFDDGMRSQLEFGVPQLNQHGLRATFYLNPRGDVEVPAGMPSWKDNLQPWLPVHQAGHEIGNHTLSHPCSLNIQESWQQGKNLLEWSLERIKEDIAEAQKRIHSFFPSQRETSFAYPCYESTVGRGANRISYIPIIAQQFVAARAKGELRGDLANDPLYCDLHYLSSWPVERQAGAFMIGLVEQAIALNRWGIFTFHGIQEGHLPVGDTDFVELLDHLVRRREFVWTASVAEVADYISNRTDI